ncbi:MAG: hypothetical protein EOO75_16775 [Myxococcales bacterium]|nr:MAG: hypothetical protein EOO75_16775 [Myxococcales bacterium]
MSDEAGQLRARLEEGDWRALVEPVSWVLLEVTLMIDPSWWPPARTCCAEELLEAAPELSPEQMTAWSDRWREVHDARGLDATIDVDIAWARACYGDRAEYAPHRIVLDLLEWYPPERYLPGD